MFSGRLEELPYRESLLQTHRRYWRRLGTEVLQDKLPPLSLSASTTAHDGDVPSTAADQRISYRRERLGRLAAAAR